MVTSDDPFCIKIVKYRNLIQQFDKLETRFDLIGSCSVYCAHLKLCNIKFCTKMVTSDDPFYIKIVKSRNLIKEFDTRNAFRPNWIIPNIVRSFKTM